MSSKRQQEHSDNTEKRKRIKKREEVAQLSLVVDDEEVKKAVKEAWSQGVHYSHENLELSCYPFPHCIIKDFLHSEAFTENLQKELLELNFHEKSNDLYKFKQSDDLRERTESHISGLRAALFGRFRSWLGDVLGVALEPTVDISCAKYQYTDILLCHDDELEGRRVAFILYLVPPWQSSDGGTLDLYATDSHLQPKHIVKSLVPSWNTLVLFEVSPVSFHQVAEVLSEDKCRLSLSGWFHGPCIERPDHHIEEPLPRSPHLPRDETLLLEWVNPMYLDISYQEQIQEEFEESSEIQLKDFLKEEKFAEVSVALRLHEIQWARRGPPNKRSFEVASLETIPSCVSDCWELLCSEAFFLLLSNFTGLRLHYLCPNDDDDDDDDDDDNNDDNDEDGENEEEEEKNQENARDGEATGSAMETPSTKKTNKAKEPSIPEYVGELRRWTHGSYTLLHDAEAVRAEYALDLILPFGCSGFQKRKDKEAKQEREKQGVFSKKDTSSLPLSPCPHTSANEPAPLPTKEDWPAEFGGFTSYVANEEDEELLTVHPEDNCLALVYRDKETLKFVKHINHKSSCQENGNYLRRTFYDFSFVYYE